MSVISSTLSTRVRVTFPHSISIVSNPSSQSSHKLHCSPLQGNHMQEGWWRGCTRSNQSKDSIEEADENIKRELVLMIKGQGSVDSKQHNLWQLCWCYARPPYYTITASWPEETSGRKTTLAVNDEFKLYFLFIQIMQIRKLNARLTTYSIIRLLNSIKE